MVMKRTVTYAVNVCAYFALRFMIPKLDVQLLMFFKVCLYLKKLKHYL